MKLFEDPSQVCGTPDNFCVGFEEKNTVMLIDSHVTDQLAQNMQLRDTLGKHLLSTLWNCFGS